MISWRGRRQGFPGPCVSIHALRRLKLKLASAALETESQVFRGADAGAAVRRLGSSSDQSDSITTALSGSVIRLAKGLNPGMILPEPLQALRLTLHLLAGRGLDILLPGTEAGRSDAF